MMNESPAAKPWTSTVTLTDGTHVLTVHVRHPKGYVENGVLFVHDYPRVTVYASGAWASAAFDGPDGPEADATPTDHPPRSIFDN